MLREETILSAVTINILLGCIWHLVTFIICVSVHPSFFSAEKKMYRPHPWERNGKFYQDVLKINKWKDALPQHIGKNGFSKDHLDDISVPYLDEFIMETCRAEWNHTMNCLYSAILFIMNNLDIALILTTVLFVLNVPFAVIQRYNRFRLQKLRRIMIRKAERTKHKTTELTCRESMADC